MAEVEPRNDYAFEEQIVRSDGDDGYTESALAGLAARHEPSSRMQQITRAALAHKEPEGWRDQFMCATSTRRQKLLLHRRDWRSRSHEKQRSRRQALDSKCGELISSLPVPVNSLSTIHEVKGSSKEKKKLRSGSRQSCPKKKRGRVTYAAFQADPALSPFFAAQNDMNPTCRPSVLERLVLKGELLLSSLLRQDSSAESFEESENDGGKPKANLINFNFAVTTAFNVPITGLMFPPLERRVRVCLCDGSNFLGNVHVFPAVTATEEEDEPWVFVNKGASRCLVQYSDTEELSLYMEVNVRYRSATVSEVPVWLSKGAEDEITCAWAMFCLPKNQADVDDLVSRSSSELPLLVGSMDQPVDVNTVRMPSGRSRVMVKRGGELSALHLHWYKLSDFQKKHARLLPEAILASNEEVPFLFLYRKALLDALLNESSLLPGDDRVFPPLIRLYPWVLSEGATQAQEVFKESWIARKLEWPPNTDCMKEKNRQRYLKGLNNSLLTILPWLQSQNVRRPTRSFHSSFEVS